jgi:signal transduction histidine kinase
MVKLTGSICMIGRISITRFFCFIITVAFFQTCSNLFSQSSNDLGYLELTDTWKYSWGESPMNEDGVFDENLSKNWQTIKYIKGILNPPDRQGAKELWLLVNLPETKWINPNLFIEEMTLPAEIYLNGQRIFKYGEANKRVNRRDYIPQLNILPIDSEFQNTTLYFRLMPEDPSFIGIGRIFIGSELDLIRKIIKEKISLVILGFIFIATGLIPLILFIKKRREKIYFAYGFFSIVMGFVTIGEARILVQLLFGHMFLRSSIFIISTFLMPVGLALYFETVFGAGYKSIIRRLWQIHLIFAMVNSFLILFNMVPFSYLVKLITIFFMIFFVTIVVLLSTSIVAAIRGSTEARIIIAGFTIFALFGLYDIVGGAFKLIPFWSGVIYPWGMFVLILSLGFVLERRFSRAHEQLREYSKGLEVKVAERTRALNEKNESLEETLAELKSTQTQLVQSEKMASLGQLTAGVAHEINNPIGAIKSNIAVNESCLDKIQTLFASDSLQKELDEGERLNKLVSILEKNNTTNKSASDRIIEIVNSLKNFARLDEAEYQKADIHEGIDSALTLLAPKLRGKIEIIKEYGNIPLINCFPHQLNQVYMNIISNAISAIENDGSLTIKTELQNSNVMIRIKDTGVGIQDKYKERIFEPFFTTRKVGEGRGLGLSISLGIIENHQGRIEFTSEVNKGSEFIITLPLKQ